MNDVVGNAVVSTVHASSGATPYTVTLTDDQRSRLLQVANACPIHNVLTGEIRIDSSLSP